MSLTRSAIRPLLLAAALLWGCGAFSPAEDASTVAEGRKYSSGNAEYDQFFSAVHRLQVNVGRAPAELREAQVALGSSANGKSLTESERARQIKAELDRLGRGGTPVRVSLRTTEAPRAVFSTANALRPADQQLLKQMEQGVSRQLMLTANLRQARSELDALCSVALRLEGKLDRTFGVGFGGRRQTVLQNLRDAERLLVLMRARVDETQKSADAFITAFAQALGDPLVQESPWSEAAARAPGRPTPTLPAAARSEPGEATPTAPAQSTTPSDTVTRAEFEP